MRILRAASLTLSGLCILFLFHNCGVVGQSTQSQSLSSNAPPSTPDAPGSFAGGGLSATSITLNWTLPVGSHNSTIRVERATDIGGPYTNIANLSNTTMSYVDNNLSPATLYFYRVYAQGSELSSPYSAIVQATTMAVPQASPAAPSNPLASVSSQNQIVISWTDNSDNESGFQIERALASGGPYSVISTTAANDLSYTDSGLSAGTTYFYRILSLNTIGSSSYTGSFSATTSSASGQPPLAPTNLTVSMISARQLTLSWTDNSVNELQFQVEQSSAKSGPYSLATSTPAGVVEAVLQNLTPATLYYFRVRAINSDGESGYTAYVPVTTAGDSTPPAPSLSIGNVNVFGVGLRLSWTSNSSSPLSGAPTYEVEKSSDVNAFYSSIPLLGMEQGSTYTSIQAQNLKPSSTYYFRARVVTSGGTSPYSPIASATTLYWEIPPVPSNFTGMAGVSNIGLQWGDNSIYEYGFEVERSANASGPFTNISTTPSNSTHYIDNSVAPSTTYYYRIRAINPLGSSAYTNVVAVTSATPSP